MEYDTLQLRLAQAKKELHLYYQKVRRVNERKAWNVNEQTETTQECLKVFDGVGVMSFYVKAEPQKE